VRRRNAAATGSAADSSVYRHLWESSLDACFVALRARRAGHVTDFVFADMNRVAQPPSVSPKEPPWEEAFAKSSPFNVAAACTTDT
jgi:hypothetical protein